MIIKKLPTRKRATSKQWKLSACGKVLMEGDRVICKFNPTGYLSRKAVNRIARIIAASPELLAEHCENASSLENIAARLESEGRIAKVNVALLRIRAQASRAAIAKATGGVA